MPLEKLPEVIGIGFCFYNPSMTSLDNCCHKQNITPKETKNCDWKKLNVYKKGLKKSHSY